MGKKILVLRTVGGKTVQQMKEHDRIWEKGTAGIAKYYDNTDDITAKSYADIIIYNNRNKLLINSTDVELMIGVYDKIYYYFKKEHGLSNIPEEETFASILNPDGTSFITDESNGIKLIFKFIKKTSKDSKSLCEDLIIRKHKELGVEGLPEGCKHHALCFTLDYDKNLDLVKLLN